MMVFTPRHEPLPEDTEARLTDFTELVHVRQDRPRPAHAIYVK
jgi:hypothetical protein